MVETGQKMPSDLVRLLQCLAGVTFIAGVPVAIFAIYAECSRYAPTIGDAVLGVGYLGWIPGLIIAYVWRFRYIPHRMFFSETLGRAVLCGLLYPIFAIVTTPVALVLTVVLSPGNDISLGLYWFIGMVICTILSIPLVRIGIVEWSVEPPEDATL
jgi:hypothetical protein